MNTTRYDCPDCDGLGDWVELGYLFADGRQFARNRRCERCQGTGWLPYDELTQDEKDQLLKAESEAA